MSVYQETPWNDVTSTEVYRQTDKLIDRFSDMEFVKNFTQARFLMTQNFTQKCVNLNELKMATKQRK